MENTERAWQGGPLRRVGTGNGKPSRYTCDCCLQPAKTGVRLDVSIGKWRCASCERGLVRQTAPTQQVRGFLRQEAA